MKEIIGGGNEDAIRMVTGAIAAVVIGEAIGIPAAVVTTAAVVGSGAVMVNKVGKLFDDEKK